MGQCRDTADPRYGARDSAGETTTHSINGWHAEAYF
jgi:hypothetical protein